MTNIRYEKDTNLSLTATQVKFVVGAGSFKDRKTERLKTERQKINLNIWLERYNTQKSKLK